MSTLTIDVPDSLVNELKKRNVSQDTLNALVQETLERWLTVRADMQPEHVRPPYVPVKLAGLWHGISIRDEDIAAVQTVW